MHTVGIIGVGAIGGALARILGARRDVSVLPYDTDPGKVAEPRRSLPETVQPADVVFFCVPSSALREALTACASFVREDALAVSLVKGIEPESTKTADVLLAELLPAGRAFGMLGGPMLAAEFIRGLPGRGIFASPFPAAGERMGALFAGTLLSLEFSDDARGVALAGVLKNIYALGLGIARGLSWGDNQRGWYLAQAVREMAEALARLGGRRESAYSLAGLGDLIATGFSRHSRNSNFGEEFARTGVCNIQSEGCASLPSVEALLRGSLTAFPLLTALGDIVLRGASAPERLQEAFSRA